MGVGGVESRHYDGSRKRDAPRGAEGGGRGDKSISRAPDDITQSLNPSTLRERVKMARG